MTTAKQSDDPHTAPLGGAPREAEPELSPPLSADERVLRAEAWRCRDYANHCDLHGNPNGAQFRAFAEAVERTLAALTAATARVRELEAERDATARVAPPVERDTNFVALRELSVEAREALGAWGPPTPEHDNPLYYPLLFLCEKVDATLRYVLKRAHDDVAEGNRAAAEWLARAALRQEEPRE